MVKNCYECDIAERNTDQDTTVTLKKENLSDFVCCLKVISEKMLVGFKEFTIIQQKI